MGILTSIISRFSLTICIQFTCALITLQTQVNSRFAQSSDGTYFEVRNYYDDNFNSFHGRREVNDLIKNEQVKDDSIARVEYKEAIKDFLKYERLFRDKDERSKKKNDGGTIQWSIDKSDEKESENQLNESNETEIKKTSKDNTKSVDGAAGLEYDFVKMNQNLIHKQVDSILERDGKEILKATKEKRKKEAKAEEKQIKQRVKSDAGSLKNVQFVGKVTEEDIPSLKDSLLKEFGEVDEDFENEHYKQKDLSKSIGISKKNVLGGRRIQALATIHKDTKVFVDVEKIVGDNNDQVASVLIDDTVERHNEKVMKLDANILFLEARSSEEETPKPQVTYKNKYSLDYDNTWFITIIGGCVVAVISGLALAGYCWCRLREEKSKTYNPEINRKKSNNPSTTLYFQNEKGIPNKSDDELMAREAEMFHFGNTKKDINDKNVKQTVTSQIGNNKNKHNPKLKNGHHNNGHINGHSSRHMNGNRVSKQSVHMDATDSEDDELDEDTVYECPGLAPPGDMKIMNPLFSDVESIQGDHRSQSSHSSQQSLTPPTQGPISPPRESVSR